MPDVAVREPAHGRLRPQVRKLVGTSVPVASIVYPAVQLEVLNTTLWPDFPYRGLANRYVDVWMPMSYYTFRSPESGLRSAYRYTVDSVDRLRRRLGDPDGAGARHRWARGGQHARRLPRHDARRRAPRTRVGLVDLRLRHHRLVGVAVPARRGAGPDDARTADHGGAAHHDRRALHHRPAGDDGRPRHQHDGHAPDHAGLTLAERRSGTCLNCPEQDLGTAGERPN